MLTLAAGVAMVKSAPVAWLTLQCCHCSDVKGRKGAMSSSAPSAGMKEISAGSFRVCGCVGVVPVGVWGVWVWSLWVWSCVWCYREYV